MPAKNCANAMLTPASAFPTRRWRNGLPPQDFPPMRPSRCMAAN
jgi:hypothetical protein